MNDNSPNIGHLASREIVYEIADAMKWTATSVSEARPAHVLKELERLCDLLDQTSQHVKAADRLNPMLVDAVAVSEHRWSSDYKHLSKDELLKVLSHRRSLYLEAKATVEGLTKK